MLSDIDRDMSEGFERCARWTLATPDGTPLDAFDASLRGFEPH